MNSDEREIKDQRIHLTPKHYITISFLIFLISMVITATYNLISYLQLAPLQQDLQKVKKEFDDQRTQNEAMKIETDKMQGAYKRLLERDESPVTMQPLDGDTVIGEMINFKWDYKYHKKYQNYILDIRCISDQKRNIPKLEVVTPTQQLMDLPTNYIGNGEFIWRIIPGYILNEQEIIQGRASNYSYFTIYKSTIERIKETRVLRVGTTPSFRGSFTFRGKHGKIEGFDIDLIEWIVPKLQSELKIQGKIECKIIKLSWADLLPSLAKHEVDLVISAMTSTKGREETNPGVKFTDGYYQSHQIFISLRNGGKFGRHLEDLSELKGKKVGVFAGTTNEQVAHFLASKYGFTIDNSYKSQDDLIYGLQNNDIHFALIDDVLAKTSHGMQFHQVGPKLDSLLTNFYSDKLGRQKEMYAIAVVEEPQATPKNLLTLVNEILRSPEGQQELQELTKTWIK
jgi:ABC-type amino acid transport substrate-binding protein